MPPYKSIDLKNNLRCAWLSQVGGYGTHTLLYVVISIFIDKHTRHISHHKNTNIPFVLTYRVIQNSTVTVCVKLKEA